MEIIALAGLVAAQALFFVYQVRQVRSRLDGLETRAEQAFNDAKEARTESQKAIDASQKAIDASQKNANTLRALPLTVPLTAPTTDTDFEPEFAEIRSLIDTNHALLSDELKDAQARVSGFDAAILKLNSRLDNLSISKGKMPDSMGL
mgnify:CR=1 FL=1